MSAKDWNKEGEGGEEKQGWFGWWGGGSDEKEKKAKEFEFLKSRRLNWRKSRQKATFNDQVEREVGNDPVVRLKDKYGQGKIAKRIISRRERIARGERILSGSVPRNPIKNPKRKTLMCVGYSNATWPERKAEMSDLNSGGEIPTMKPPLPSVRIKKVKKPSVQAAIKKIGGVAGEVTIATTTTIKNGKNGSGDKDRAKGGGGTAIRRETVEVLKSMAKDATRAKTAAGGSLPTALKEREKMERLKLQKVLAEKENDIKGLQNQIDELRKASVARIRRLEEKCSRANLVSSSRQGVVVSVKEGAEKEKQKVSLADSAVHVDSVFRFLQPTGHLKSSSTQTASAAAPKKAVISQRFPLRKEGILVKSEKIDNFGDPFFEKRRKALGTGGRQGKVRSKDSTLATKSSKAASPSLIYTEDVLRQGRFKKNMIRTYGRSSIHAIGGSTSGANLRKRPGSSSADAVVGMTSSLARMINHTSPPKLDEQSYKKYENKLMQKKQKQNVSSSSQRGGGQGGRGRGRVRAVDSPNTTLQSLNEDLDAIHESLLSEASRPEGAQDLDDEMYHTSF